MNAKNLHPNQAKKQRKIDQVIWWIYRWGWTDIHAVTLLLDCSSKTAYRTMEMMRAAGWIRSYRVATCPVTIIGLTLEGLSRAKLLDALTKPQLNLSPPTSPSRMPRTPVHGLLVQQFALQSVRSNKLREFTILSEAEIKATDMRLMPKRDAAFTSRIWPDAIIQFGARKLCVEVQESREEKTTAERRLSQYAEMIADGTVHRVIWASTSLEIVTQLTTIRDAGLRPFWREKKTITPSGTDPKTDRDFEAQHINIWSVVPGLPTVTVEEGRMLIIGIDEYRNRYYADGGPRGVAVLI